METSAFCPPVDDTWKKLLIFTSDAVIASLQVSVDATGMICEIDS